MGVDSIRRTNLVATGLSWWHDMSKIGTLSIEARNVLDSIAGRA